MEKDFGAISWSNNNTTLIKEMLEKKGLESSTLKMETLTCYSLQLPLSLECHCVAHKIVVLKDWILQQCRCRLCQVLGKSPRLETIFELCPTRSKICYEREKARPLRVPKGYKFVGLRSDTGTGKNHQLEVFYRDCFTVNSTNTTQKKTNSNYRNYGKGLVLNPDAYFLVQGQHTTKT
jgi:hypothetical protein